jgi:predicted dehydrogenase
VSERALRAGVIGLGVGERHIAGYEADRRCHVVALCDTDGERLRTVGERYPGRRLFADPAGLLADPSIDVVSIASFDDDHYAQVMAALLEGKHIFVEKPICMRASELADIRAALAANPKLRLSSNLILRRSPRFARLRERVRRGELGVPYYCEADYNYGRIQKIVEGWRGQRQYYSVTHGGGIHLIDLIMWILGEKPVVVSAFGNAIATRDTQFKFNDCVAALLKFPSGAVAKITANFGCMFPHHHNLSVYGTKATFVHDRLGARLYTSRDPDAAAIPIEDAYVGPAKGDMLPAFVASILDGSAPDVATDEVIDAMEVSLAIEEAARFEQTVKLR